MDGLTAAEQGFLLLTSHLGVAERKPLTAAQLRQLSQRVHAAGRKNADADLHPRDLIALGYTEESAERICQLLQETELLRYYLEKGKKAGCFPITRASEKYPIRVRRTLGLDAPGCLWAKGDAALLHGPKIALVGCRDLAEPNREFARKAGQQAALQGYALVSGNARGADKISQEACLEAGGHVISVVADNLQKHPLTRNVLYLSLDDFDQGFSVQRALQRNYVIHTMGSLVVAAQCSFGKGGTWDGTLTNLSHKWTPVCMYDDGSDAAAGLQNCGARLIHMEELQDLSALMEEPICFL